MSPTPEPIAEYAGGFKVQRGDDVQGNVVSAEGRGSWEVPDAGTVCWFERCDSPDGIREVGRHRRLSSLIVVPNRRLISRSSLPDPRDGPILGIN
jgi:hypothetical protein